VLPKKRVGKKKGRPEDSFDRKSKPDQRKKKRNREHVAQTSLSQNKVGPAGLREGAKIRTGSQQHCVPEGNRAVGRKEKHHNQKSPGGEIVDNKPVSKWRLTPKILKIVSGSDVAVPRGSAVK